MAMGSGLGLAPFESGPPASTPDYPIIPIITEAICVSYKSVRPRIEESVDRLILVRLSAIQMHLDKLTDQTPRGTRRTA